MASPVIRQTCRRFTFRPSEWEDILHSVHARPYSTRLPQHSQVNNLGTASRNSHNDCRSGIKSPADFLRPDPLLSPHRDPKIAEAAAQKLFDLGYDPESFWEQEIVWGDHDSFQHVNNVRYVRFFESGRIKWMTSLGHELGGASKAQAMLQGRGVSLILKSISMNYKAPVTYPDTLLIAHKPIVDELARTGSLKARTHMSVKAVGYSYKQRRIVTESDSVCVWYDYDKLAKCDPGEEVWRVVENRMGLGRG
ncbi:Thioesterase/thiol ester dehydrase-isomerase [Cristinia sonorae]|uniref:Thioesterase/thiol ester dehydrase-isomerase n=1 Tax=Cristinia sonorae TaxID=1940300 RepID=A0A8K0XSM8_9AGAR|nr:Thioesterase/thiol ester dehydrase-isomerase [Cristinia sonorae]